MAYHIESPKMRLSRVFIRWRHAFLSGSRFLGDAWERSYGDLEWRGPAAHRQMPWYFLVTDGVQLAGYGVETGCASLACWSADAEGVTLELDVRCGGMGVQLGARVLVAAILVQRLPVAEEMPFLAARRFCRALCREPRLPKEPIIGHNDWYWLYGKNSERKILQATERFVEFCPPDRQIKPWSVIDDGWQRTYREGDLGNGGPWNRGNSKFSSLPRLVEKIKKLGARPGIWMRPLLTTSKVPASWQTRRPNEAAKKATFLDPSVPEVLEHVRADIARLRAWGFELIKHDFSTFDITGRWGFEMLTADTGFCPGGWRFANSKLTTAEIILNFYRVIRAAAGAGTLIMGCNTVGHLAAGLVEIQRTGDDTSALDWNRTRRMGVNTLAFRAPQHDAFFAIDADCVPIAPSIPWRLTASWLDLIARSGTPLFLSINPLACDRKTTKAIRTALDLAARASDVAQPLDWLDTPIPVRWKLQCNSVQRETRMNWTEWAIDDRSN